MIKKILISLLFTSLCFGLVSNQTDRVSYVGNGSLTAFTYSYPANATSDLEVKLVLVSDGNEVATLSETTHYTATAGESGGTVTTVSFPSSITHPLTSSYEIHIRRVTPKTQTLNLEVGKAVNLERLEDAHDKSMKVAIEAYQNGLRSIRFPSSSDEVGEMTPISDWLNKYLAINSSGVLTPTDGTSETTVHSAWGASWAGIADSSAGLTELYTIDHVLTSDHSGDVDVAIDAADANAVIINDVLGTAAVLSEDKTITVNQTFKNMPGCVVSGTGSPTLTINGVWVSNGRSIDIDTVTLAGEPKIYGEGFNVKWTGAVADDGLSDRDEIQAMIDLCDAAGGGKVYIPPSGQYDILAADTSLSPGDYVTIEGGGFNSHVRVEDINCFEFAHADNLVYEPIFKNFRITGSANTTGYGIYIKSGTAQNVIDMHIEHMTIKDIGGIYAEDSVDLTKLQIEECRIIQSNNYGFYVEGGNGTELNGLRFKNTWWDAHLLGAIYINNQSGYTLFDSCIFESVRSQYAVYVKGGDINFESCLFFNNGNNSSSPPTDGADVYIANGTNSNMAFNNCRFLKPSTHAISWYSIIEAEPEAMTSVENSFIDITDSNHIAFYYHNTIGTNHGRISNNLISSNKDPWYIVDGNTSLITKNNKFSDTNSLDVSDIHLSVKTTDATKTTVWGGTFYGPFLEFPDANSTVAYKATVVARDADPNSVYLYREQWSLVELEETSDSVYTLTVRDSNVPIDIKKGTLTSAFEITNNGTATAAIKFTVTGVAATTIRWSVRIEALGARIPSTF